MSKIKTSAAALGVALAVGVGSLAMATAPAEAGTKGNGTVTQAEGKRVTRQMLKQRCLTLNETRHIVNGRGSKVGKRTYRWRGKEPVTTFRVHFKHGCAYKTVRTENGA